MQLLKGRWQNTYSAIASSLCPVQFKEMIREGARHRARCMAGAQEVCAVIIGITVSKSFTLSQGIQRPTEP